MTIKQIGYMRDFNCMQAACLNPCCQIWKIAVTDEKQKLWAAKAPELLASLEKAENGDARMKLAERNLCACFKDGLCTIQQKYGADFQPEICDIFPRFYKNLAGEIYQFAYMTCFGVTKRMIRSNPEDFCWYSVAGQKLSDHPYEIPLAEYAELKQSSLIELTDTVLRLVATEQPSAFIPAKLLAFANLLDQTPTKTWIPDLLEKLYSSVDACVRETFTSKITMDPEVEINKVLIAFLKMIKTDYRQAALVELLDNINQKLGNGLNIKNGYHKQLANYKASPAYAYLEPILKNYLLVKLVEIIFPLDVYFPKRVQEIVLIVHQYLMVKLALICALDKQGNPPSEDQTCLIIQTLEKIYLGKTGKYDFYAKDGLVNPEKLIKLLAY